MGHDRLTPHPMMRRIAAFLARKPKSRHIGTAGLRLFLPLLLVLSGCYKDEVDLPALTTNPLANDSLLWAEPVAGAAVTTFTPTADAFVSTKFKNQNYGNWPDLRASYGQRRSYVSFNVQGLTGTVTSVRFKDPEADSPVIVAPVPGTYIYRFQRTVVEPFVERCYSVALWNAFSESRAENICCTLQ